MMTVAPPLVLLMGSRSPNAGPDRPAGRARRYRRSGLGERQRRVHGAAVAGGAPGVVPVVTAVVIGVGAAGVVAAAACSASRRKASSSIALAPGPASLPPVLAEISALVPFSMTATTYFGSSTGAKATIQACERCGSPGPLS